ncbi:TatD family hydrolase [Candidatus Falkowbacteria bacterium]|nr:TatD family hydrolase [Candidatus Falkowbacteria bacterium]
MLFDTHAHLNFEAFENDWRETAKRALLAGIKIINVGSNLETSKKAVAIAEEFSEGVYAAVGLHPSEVQEEQLDIKEYKKLAAHPKVVALGEIGLDYYRLPDTIRPEGAGGVADGKQIKTPTEIKNLQKEVLLKFLKLSEETKLPVIVHCRDAHADLIDLLEKFDKPKGFDARGVMHCFSGSFEEARRYLNLGFLISFTGIITFAHFEGETLAKTPLNKIMVETDCPYLTPEPHRGKRNEPLFVEFVAKEVARIKNESYEEVARVTTENAKRLFQKIK